MLHSSPRSTVAPRMDTKEYTTKKGAQPCRCGTKSDETRAVQSPADDGGECKAAQRHRREDGRPAAVGGGEAGDRQLGTGRRAVVDRDTAAQDDQRGQCADHNGIRKHLKDAEESLLYRLFVSAQAWAMEPVPRPASLEKIPRETPFCILTKRLPMTAPVKAAGLKAPRRWPR